MTAACASPRLLALIRKNLGVLGTLSVAFGPFFYSFGSWKCKRTKYDLVPLEPSAGIRSFTGKVVLDLIGSRASGLLDYGSQKTFTLTCSESSSDYLLPSPFSISQSIYNP